MNKRLKVRVNRSKPESMTRQIINQLTTLIQTGELAAGELLPSERTLADTLGVARNVVRRSYEYLSTGGQIVGEGRQGRRVGSSSGKSGKRSGSSSGGGARKSAKAGGKSSKASARGGAKKSGRKGR